MKSYLYPLATPVVVAKVDVADTTYTYSYATPAKNSFAASVAAIRSEADLSIHKPRVLINGLYVSKSRRIGGIEANVIVNIYNGSQCFVEQDINPASACMLTDTPNNKHLACVSGNGKSLYIYNLSFVQDGSPTKSIKLDSDYPMIASMLSAEYMMEFAYTLKTPGEHITSVIPFAYHDQACLAVATDSGNILLGRISNNIFHCHTYWNDDHAPDLELLSSTNGIITAYSKTNGVLYCHGDDQFGYRTIQCPSLYNLKLSANGDYITGLEFQGGQRTYKVHAFHLPSCQHEVLCFEDPVQDFCIGHNDEIGIIQKEKTSFPGKFKTLLDTLIQTQKNHQSSIFSRTNSGKITLLDDHSETAPEPRCVIL